MSRFALWCIATLVFCASSSVWAQVSASPSISTDGTITVSWSSIYGSQTFQVFESKDGASATTVHNGIGTQATLTGRTNGTYTYTVREWFCPISCMWVSHSGSATVTVSMPSAPSTPANISAPSTASTGSYTVSWGASSGTLTSYQLQERANGGSWSTVYNGTSRSRSYNKTQNNYYDYRVRACNNSACSGYTSTRRVTVPAASISLNAPSTISRTDSTFTLSWSSTMTSSCSLNEGGVSGTSGSQSLRLPNGWSYMQMPNGYYWTKTLTMTCSVINGGSIQESAFLMASTQQPYPTVDVSWSGGNSGYVGQSKTLNWLTSNANSCTLDNGSVSTSGSRSYTYNSAGNRTKTVTCTNERGSRSDSATVSINYPAPGIPGNIAGPSTASNGSYTISWGAASGTITEYQLQERANGGSWSNVYTGTSRSRSYNKAQDNYYDYRVRACNTGSCSSYTPNKRVTIPEASISLNGPSTISRTDSTFNLSWSSVMTSSCSLNEGGVSGTSGSQSLRLPNGWSYMQMPNGYYWTKTLTMTCSVINGGSIQESLMLLAESQQPLPSINVSWSSNDIYVGDSSTLSWSSSNANGCSLDNASVSTSGSRSYTYNSSGNYSKTVTCTNERGSNSSSASVTVSYPTPSRPGDITGPSTADTGQYTLSWNSATGDVTEYQLQESANNGSWSTIYTGMTRSQSFSKTANNTYDYRVRACNHNACSAYQDTKRVTIPAANISLSTDPSSLVWTTDSFTLTWSSVMTNNCSWNDGALSGTSGSSVVSLSDGWVETNPFGTPFYQNTITVTCSVIGGGNTSSSFELISANGAQPAPGVSLSWSSSSVVVGSSVTLEWSSDFADSCSLDGATVDSSGSQSHTLDSVGTETRTLTCSNAQGSRSDSATISVVHPDPAFTYLRGVSSRFGDAPIESSDPLTLWGFTNVAFDFEWASINTGSCFVRAGTIEHFNLPPSGDLPFHGENLVWEPTQFVNDHRYQTSIELTCIGLNGDEISMPLVLSADLYGEPRLPAANAQWSVDQIGLNESVLFSWTSDAASSCSLNGSEVDLSGSITTSFVTGGTHTWSLTCSNAHGPVTSEDSISVLDSYLFTTVQGGNTVSSTSDQIAIDWTSRNVSECSIAGQPIDAGAGSGTVIVDGITQEWTSSGGQWQLTLPATCLNQNNEDWSHDITITANSQGLNGSVSWVSDQIMVGQTGTFQWQLTGANNCTDWFGMPLSSGSGSVTEVFDAAGEHTYAIDCEDAQGTPYRLEATLNVSAFPVAVDPEDEATPGEEFYGFVSGTFKVTPGGAATYSIPIDVPPGIRGLQPKLTIGYSSSARNGLLGWGWGVSGQSKIHRCPADIARDRFVAGTMDGQHFRYCIDGERLVLVDNAGGTEEYRTERESYRKIIRNEYGGFTVLSRDGRTIEYGGRIHSYDDTAESRLVSANGSDYVEWHISRVTDIAGNYITYHYEIDSANGIHRMSHIDYTKNEDVEAVDLNHRVQFVYEDRDDQYAGYAHGVYSQMDQRLQRIEVRADNLLVRSYNLDYQVLDGVNYHDPAQTSRLDNIKVCYDILETQCSEPLHIEWNERVPSDYSFTNTNIFNRSNSGSLNYALADINGDGRQQVVYTYGYANSEVYVTEIGGTADYSQGQRIANFSQGGFLVGTMDLNSDGKDDLLYTVIDNLINHTMVAFANDDGFDDELTLLFSDDYLLKRPLQFQDLDGDGHIDAIRHTPQTRVDGLISYEVARNIGNGTFLEWAEWGRHSGSDPESTRLADVNGDGLPDIVRCDYIENSYNDQSLNKCRYLVSLNLGWGEFGPAQLWGNTEIDSVPWIVRDRPSSHNVVQHMIFADVNGDRLADVVFADENDLKISINNGQYFEDLEVWLDEDVSDVALLFLGGLPFTLGDLNDDGKADLVFRTNGGASVAYNRGRVTGYEDGGGFSQPQSLNEAGLGVTYAINVTDLNADGISDLSFVTPLNYDIDGLVFYNVNGDLDGAKGATNPLSKNLVYEVREHAESFTEIQYLPLTDTSVHTQGEPGDRRLNVVPTFPLTTVTNIVSQGSGSSKLALTSAIDRQHYVVDIVERSDGIGGIVESEYHYTGLLTHKQGWGSLGFSEVQIDTITHGTGDHFRNVMEYSQEFGELYKAAGLPLRTSRYAILDSGPQLISETVNKWHIQGLRDEIDNWGLYSPHYVVQREEQHAVRFDLNGAHISDRSTFSLAYDDTPAAACITDSVPSVNATETALTAFDIYGNLHQTAELVCGAGEVFTTTSKKLYENRIEEQWQLGLVINDQVTNTAPDQNGELQSLTREKSATYTEKGLPFTQTREPNNSDLSYTTTFSAYDAYGVPTSIVESWNNADGLGFTTRASLINIDYATDGTRTIKATNAALHETTTVVDGKFGQVRSFTDENQLTTKTEFDIVGRIKLITAPDTTTVETRYRTCNGCDSPNNRARYYISSKATGASPQREYYDAHGRSVGQRTIGLNGTASYTEVIYDAAGRVEYASDPFFSGATRYYTVYDYDSLGRPKLITATNDGESETHYNGLETTIINALEQQRKLWNNALGQNSRTEDHNGTAIKYAYDPFGNLLQTEVTPSGETSGVITSMGYDLIGRQSYLDDPSAGRIDYTYNGLDLMATSTDAKNQRTEFTYDVLGRQITRVDHANAANSGLRTHQWVYDSDNSGKGRLDSVVGFDTDGVAFNETYHYNAYGLPTSSDTTIQGEFFTTETFYDEFNRPVGIAYPTGVTIVNHYDSFGYRHRVSRGLDNELWTATAADARGNITQSQHGNGVVTTSGYEEDTGYVKSINVIGSNNLVVQNHEYTYDAIGNLLTRTDKRVLNGIGYTQAFCYDDLNRLKAVRTDSCGNSDEDITYDGLGNIQTRIMPQNGVTQNYTYDPSNPYRLLSTDIGGSYGYDENGNITSGGGRTISYSSFDKPTRMTKYGNTVEITYGPDQKRVKRVDNTTAITTYVAGIYEKREENGKVSHLHQIGDIALYVQEEENNSTTSYTRFLHHDHIGSLAAKTNESGDVVEFMANDPWGYRQDDSWLGEVFGTEYVPLDTRKGYTEHEHLDGVGLIHMNGRVYDPDLGRFLSADPFVQAPANTQSFNRYAYVFNNPFRYTDPSGFNATNAEDELLDDIIQTDDIDAEAGRNNSSNGKKSSSQNRNNPNYGKEGTTQACQQTANCTWSGTTEISVEGGTSVNVEVGSNSNTSSSSGENIEGDNTVDSIANRASPSGSKVLPGGALKPGEELVKVTASAKDFIMENILYPGSNLIINDKGQKGFFDQVLTGIAYSLAAGETIFLELANGGVDFEIRPTSGDSVFGVIPSSKKPIIMWNPKEGLKLKRGGRQSPALGLIHEAQHAFDYINKGIKAAKKESPVIKGIEARVANFHGEGVRKLHSDGKVFTAQCVTCNF